MIIVAIHGAIGHGKTTFADMLQIVEPNSAHFESSTIIAEVLQELHKSISQPFEDDAVTFVNSWFVKLPLILNNLMGIDITPGDLLFTEADVREDPLRFQKLLEHANNLQKNPQLALQDITAANKSLYRAGLQGLGGYFIAKISPTIWFDEIIRRITAQPDRKLCAVGGLRFPAEAEVIRKAGGVVVEIIRPGAPEPDNLDPTEAYRKQIVSDTVIINNGDQKQLALLAPFVLHDISADDLKDSYRAVA